MNGSHMKFDSQNFDESTVVLIRRKSIAKKSLILMNF